MPNDFAFSPKRSADTKKRIKGTLEVRAKRDTQMGDHPTRVPAGSIGYVMAARGGDPGWLVHWPDIKKDHSGDWRTAVHDKNDLEPTGRRG